MGSLVLRDKISGEIQADDPTWTSGDFKVRNKVRTSSAIGADRTGVAEAILHSGLAGAVTRDWGRSPGRHTYLGSYSHFS